MNTVTKDNVAQVVATAREAANVATQGYLDNEPDNWFPCGFAWVRIKPARGILVNYMKSIDMGGKAYGGGYQIWNPSDITYTQVMYAKLAGAQAFANVLQDYGVNAYAESRID